MTRGFEYFTAEEDVELEKPLVFSAAITHKHNGYAKTVYVKATCYRDAIIKLTEKLNEFRGKVRGNGSEYSLGIVYKDKKSPLDLLLSKWRL